MSKKILFLIITILFNVSSFAYAGNVGFSLKEDRGKVPLLKDVALGLPSELGTFTFYGLERFRINYWDYFERNGPTKNDYMYGTNLLRLGAKFTNEYFTAHVAWQYVQHVGLPDKTSPGAGDGSLYFAHTRERSPGGMYIKYLHLDLKDFLDIGITGSFGRFDYSSGMEVLSTGDKKLDGVKKSRIRERLIGGFGWSQFQRSFDGVKAAWDSPVLKLNFAAMHPTAGGFEERAGNSIEKIDIITTTATFKKDVLAPRTEGQLFYNYYSDSRAIAGRIDNSGRPSPNGTQDIDIHMIGGHLVGAAELGPGEIDYMSWGGIQLGNWFGQDHRAFAVAGEAGYQLKELWGKPWIRGGYFYGSGDSDGSDSIHQTFYQMAPTGRIYSKSILFNLMNNEDLFVSLDLFPHEKVKFQMSYHWVNLANKSDRWYVGSGPTQEKGIIQGYAGRNTLGNDDLGHLIDFGLTVKVSKDIKWYTYYGIFNGGRASETVFPKQNHANFIYSEVVFKF